MSQAEAYLGPEARARRQIDDQLVAAGWLVQDYRQMNLGAARGVAVREFPLAPGHGRADYLAPQDPNDEPASVLLERIRAERESAKPGASEGPHSRPDGTCLRRENPANSGLFY